MDRPFWWLFAFITHSSSQALAAPQKLCAKMGKSLHVDHFHSFASSIMTFYTRSTTVMANSVKKNKVLKIAWKNAKFDTFTKVAFVLRSLMQKKWDFV